MSNHSEPHFLLPPHKTPGKPKGRKVIHFFWSHQEKPGLVVSGYLLSLISVAFPGETTIESTQLEKAEVRNRLHKPFPWGTLSSVTQSCSHGARGGDTRL